MSQVVQSFCLGCLQTGGDDESEAYTVNSDAGYQENVDPYEEASTVRGTRHERRADEACYSQVCLLIPRFRAELVSEKSRKGAASVGAQLQHVGTWLFTGSMFMRQVFSGPWAHRPSFS